MEKAIEAMDTTIENLAISIKGCTNGYGAATNAPIDQDIARLEKCIIIRVALMRMSEGSESPEKITGPDNPTILDGVREFMESDETEVTDESESS